MSVHSGSNWDLAVLVFVGRGKRPEYLEKNLSEQRENQQQTQPTCEVGTGNRTRATLVGGEFSHHCATTGRHHWAPPLGATTAPSLLHPSPWKCFYTDLVLELKAPGFERLTPSSTASHSDASVVNDPVTASGSLPVQTFFRTIMK